MEGDIRLDWLTKPWMYFKPKNSDSLAAWRNTWITYVLLYAQQKNVHIISIKDLRQEPPFKKMDLEAFDDIVKTLVNQGYGTWWDQRKQQLRIYWRSLECWAEAIVQTAKNREKFVILGTKDLITLEPKLATMPERDLEEILKIIVQYKFAHWINKDKKIIKLE